MTYINHYALLNPMTSKYYLNIFGDPLLLDSEEEALRLLDYEKTNITIEDIDLYVPVSLPETDFNKLNKISSTRSIVYDQCV